MALTDGNGREPDATSGAVPGADREVLSALIEVHRRLDLADQLEALARLAVAWTGAEAAFAFATEDDRQTLVPVASVRARGNADVTGVRIRAGDLRRWVEDGEPAERTAELLSESVPPSSILLPIRAAGDEVVALLALLGARGAGDELARVRSLASLARRAFENALQVRAIRDLVIKDDTTECFNRRYFEEFLAEEMSRASRFHAPLSLIFFDMDGLKQVNSLLGHAMGSRALYEVSVRVRGKVRKFDKLFRFGGDEFCIVLPETEWHGALEVAERVRVAIAGKPFLADHLGDRGGVKMTASFGIASFPLHARTKAELLERADWAMQRIKSGVKNSIAIAEIVEEGHGA